MKKITQCFSIPTLIAILALCASCKKNNVSDMDSVVQNGTPSVAAFAVPANTSTQKETGFEDGTIDPFFICTTQNPNYGQAFTLNSSKCMKFFWTQTGYDGTRNDRGAEACSNLSIFKDGWYGFHFYLPSSGFPTDKSQTIAQIFANGGCASWTGMLEVINNELWLTYRDNCASTGNTSIKLTGSIQRNAWKDVIIHFRTSHANAGLMEVWYAGAGKSTPTYRATNINFAFGNWNGDSLASDSPIGLKFGMYCWDDSNYTTGETRTLYFDNVSQLSGNPSNAWETVNPNL